MSTYVQLFYFAARCIRIQFVRGRLENGEEAARTRHFVLRLHLREHGYLTSRGSDPAVRRVSPYAPHGARPLGHGHAKTPERLRGRSGVEGWICSG